MGIQFPSETTVCQCNLILTLERKHCPHLQVSILSGPKLFLFEHAVINFPWKIGFRLPIATVSYPTTMKPSPAQLRKSLTVPSGPGSPRYRSFTITLTHTTVSRTPLEEWSARSNDIYLTTHHIQKRQTSMFWQDSNSQYQHASGRRPTP